MVCFLNPNIPKTRRKISGLKNTAKAVKTTITHQTEAKSDKMTWDPKKIKNIATLFILDFCLKQMLRKSCMIIEFAVDKYELIQKKPQYRAFFVSGSRE